ncbi:hypothetical protein GT022_03780 [Agaribacter marinus]|uniref:Uncharacterized protein n=1 Tax=Virgibacillus salarius TaxID=447199 RepID=A0A941IBE4_9BACI|nr:hypothetical protein [Virgibacillus salarius]MBR7795165.1 hypothetical protein [Virgibacillus salarius]NAZ07881.1 hypothetical protein [Agaribacter marinus]
MENNNVFISDNFLSFGYTTMKNKHNEKIGYLDLKTAFSSGAAVYDDKQVKQASGKLASFSNQWTVYDHNAKCLV